MSRDLFNSINDNIKIKFKLINNNQYHNALRDFMKYGTFMRFPTKYVFQWKNLTLENIFKLSSLSDIHGHSSHFPFDEFYDIFDYNQDTGEERDGDFSKWCQKIYKITKNEDLLKDYDFESCYDYLDEIKNLDDITPQFSNGHHVLSDFATEPLNNLAIELDDAESAEEIIVVINKILDVTHQRSDIAELFIKGGSSSLDDVFQNKVSYVTV